MDGKQGWKLFFATGLPEAYLYAKQKERKERYASGDQGHRPERDCI